jgi:hypothetical protein
MSNHRQFCRKVSKLMKCVRNTAWSRGSSVSIATRLRARRPRIDFRHGQGIFLFATAFGPTLGPTQPSIQQIQEVPSPGVKRLGREADHSLPSSIEVKNARSYTSIPPYVFMTWCLVKNRNNNCT